MISNKHTEQSAREELNLEHILSSLARRWQYIIAGITTGGFLAVIITTNTKPIWSGNFKMVISSSSQESGLRSLIGSNPMLSGLASFGGAGGSGLKLETDLKILESPSVLYPVFEELHTKSVEKGEPVSTSYRDWASNLSLRIEKGTSVLSIDFTGTNKTEIVPTLNQLVSAYQDYSLRERSDSILNAIKYATEQVSIYRKRAEDSFRELNTYALEYGISPTTSKSSGGIDVSGVLAGTNSTNRSFSSAGPVNGGASSRGNSESLTQLGEINRELIRLEQTFTNNDPNIISLKKERDALRRYIESSAFGSVAYPGAKVLSKDQAQGILLRYQDLQRRADRDQSTLNSFETALLSLGLEQARSTAPWQVISAPRLLDKPIEPRLGRNIWIGIFSGLTFGLVSALLADHRTGRIFNDDQLLELLPTNVMLSLPSNERQIWTDRLQLLSRLITPDISIGVMPLGDENLPAASIVKDLLGQIYNSNTGLCRTTTEASKFEKILLLTAPGTAQRSKSSDIIKELLLQKKEVIGCIWIDP